MGKVSAYKRENIFKFRRNKTGNRKRNRPHGWQQQGNLSRTNQSQDLLNSSCQFDAS